MLHPKGYLTIIDFKDYSKMQVTQIMYDSIIPDLYFVPLENILAGEDMSHIIDWSRKSSKIIIFISSLLIDNKVQAFNAQAICRNNRGIAQLK